MAGRICALIRAAEWRDAVCRTVKTASGATAVQIVHSSHRGSRDIEHIGSVHDDAELELLKAAARQRLAAGQGELDLDLDAAALGGPLPVTASRMGCLLDALSRAYDVLGFGAAAGGDEVFRGLVLARIIESASKLDSLRVLEEAGAAAPSYRTVLRRLHAYAKEPFRQELSAACAAHARLGPASLVLYDVSIYRHLRDSIEAHLAIVFAALAISRWIEHQTGWSIRKFTRTARRYRTIQIQAGQHTITAADPLPADLRAALPWRETVGLNTWSAWRLRHVIGDRHGCQGSKEQSRSSAAEKVQMRAPTIK
jgi:hypothetical protein